MTVISNLRRTLADGISTLSSRRLLRAGSLGVADQAVSSAANFVFMVVAARMLGPSAFGLFALLFSLLALGETVHASLVSTPHTIFSADKEGVVYRRYTGAVAVFHFIVALAAAGLVLVAAGVTWYFFGASLAVTMMLLAGALVFWLTQSFLRKVMYVESRVGAALANNLVADGSRIVLLGVLVLTAQVSEQTLFGVIGAALLAGSVFGFIQVRGSFVLTFDRRVIREHWEFGNWLGVGKIVEMAPNYITAALLSTTLSLGAYGAYRAGRQMLNLSHIPLRALDNLLRPRLAREARRGPDAVMRLVAPVLLLGSTGFILFGGLVIGFREQLFGVIFGSEYTPYAIVVVLLALRPTAELLNEVLTNVLLAFRQSRAVFVRTLFGTATGTLLGSLLILTLGSPAAGAIALVVPAASVAWMVWEWRRYVRGTHRASDQTTVSAETLTVR